MNATQPDNNQNDDEWIQKLIAEEQRRADAAGVHLLEHMAHENGDILKPVIVKTLKHAKAHRNGCPDDCKLQASLERLKQRYSISDKVVKVKSRH